jgi:hypothetical protein
MKNVVYSYKHYKESSENPIPLKQYRRVINDFNKHTMSLIFEGEEVKLPARMGVISIKGKKIEPKIDENGRIKGQAPNYKATNELWGKCPECKAKKQLIFHLNEHTDGIRYKFFWSKARMLVENKTFYTMVFTRTNKRTIPKLIEQGKEYYVEPTKYVA